MDEKDREILQLLQGSFPIDPEPYKVIGDKVWLDEVSVISRVARMIESGVIRYVGPFFDSRKLGFKGTLAAINVEPDKIDQVSNVVNSFSEITHNYLRSESPNLWFTVIAPDENRLNEIFSQIQSEAGVDKIFRFPARKMFKVKVDLD
jgi:siroheme decarboxylase